MSAETMGVPNALSAMLFDEQEAEIADLRRQLTELQGHMARLQRARDAKHADLLTLWQFARSQGRLTNEHIAVHTNIPVPAELETERSL